MEKAVFNVLSPGLLTTIQDRGREGFLQYGIPVSGAMDYYSMQIANILLGNEKQDAVLEITMTGPSLKVLCDTTIAICGADLTPTINNIPVELWRPITVKCGDTLSFGKRRNGVRCYLAVIGGFSAQIALHSASTYIRGKFGGINGRMLQKGDCLSVAKVADFQKRGGCFLSPKLIPSYQESTELRVIVGPDDAMFTIDAHELFFSSAYKMSRQSDRMGYRLEGPPLTHLDEKDILSDAITFGTIQVPANGLPIMMGADRQTTGGYPRIATIITVDQKQMAQLLPGALVSFKEVTVEEAHHLYKEEVRNLNILAYAVKNAR